MKYTYIVEHSRNAIYTRDFTSRRKAEQYITRLRRLTICGDATQGSFTIRRMRDIEQG